MPMPTQWDATALRGQVARFIQISHNGCRAKYVGQGTDDRDAASVRADHPVPADCPIFYFEVEIVNAGRDGFIGIGFCTRDVNLDRLPGWEPHSYGYHGDDGHVFSGRGTGRAYGPMYTTGDWLGIILNRVERTISFTKKGYDLGVAFEDVSETWLYPAVGFRTPDEEVLVNFGNDLVGRPFKGDVELVKQEAQSRLYSKILATPIIVPSITDAAMASGSRNNNNGNTASNCTANSRTSIIGEILFDYLKHHGYWESASAVARDILGGTVQVPMDEINLAALQSSMREKLLDGDVDGAMTAAESLAPGVMEASPHVAFRLKCLKFCELIKAGRDEEAMVYGREELGPSCSNSSDDRALLEDALALFAYADPATSPSGHLLSASHCAELAAELDKAVLSRRGCREESSLERVWRQTEAVKRELKRQGDPAASLLGESTHLMQIVDGLYSSNVNVPVPADDLI
jgi:Ran-binding protein 9/10